MSGAKLSELDCDGVVIGAGAAGEDGWPAVDRTGVPGVWAAVDRAVRQRLAIKPAGGAGR
ncbi:hypothetical protein KIPE111705_39345 [Kibdelosporangium persicum]|uniref:hypothetical protein n=1 Tax=Kibdelosporangium persicum TaxID=2698649 RepID=UPI0015679A40|nr:hypothetical protein [Kibdelosporangium persicum]